MRWCTKNMKIKPIEEWIGDAPAVSYVAIRADESNRKGYISTKTNISSTVPVRGGRRSTMTGVLRILDDAGIGLPSLLRVAHPLGLLLLLLPAQGRVDRPVGAPPRAVRPGSRPSSRRSCSDAGVNGDADFGDQAMRGRQYTWSGGETLHPTQATRRDQILERHEATLARTKSKARPNLPLI